MDLDTQNLFSDRQAITASGPSTNVIDLGAAGTPRWAPKALGRDLGRGRKVPLLIQVVEDFNNLTSLKIDLQTSNVETFSSVDTLASQTMALADLVAGARPSFDELQPGVKRYVRLYYTVTGTAPTVGRITAGISAGNNQRQD